MLIRLGSLSQQSRQEFSPFGESCLGSCQATGLLAAGGGDGGKSAGSLSFFRALAF